MIRILFSFIHEKKKKQTKTRDLCFVDMLRNNNAYVRSVYISMINEFTFHLNSLYFHHIRAIILECGANQ